MPVHAQSGNGSQQLINLRDQMGLFARGWARGSSPNVVDADLVYQRGKNLVALIGQVSAQSSATRARLFSLENDTLTAIGSDVSTGQGNGISLAGAYAGVAHDHPSDGLRLYSVDDSVGAGVSPFTEIDTLGLTSEGHWSSAGAEKVGSTYYLGYLDTRNAADVFRLRTFDPTNPSDEIGSEVGTATLPSGGDFDAMGMVDDGGTLKMAVIRRVGAIFNAGSADMYVYRVNVSNAALTLESGPTSLTRAASFSYTGLGFTKIGGALSVLALYWKNSDSSGHELRRYTTAGVLQATIAVPTGRWQGVGATFV